MDLSYSLRSDLLVVSQKFQRLHSLHGNTSSYAQGKCSAKTQLRGTSGAELGLEPRLGINSSPAKSHLVDQGDPAEAQSHI